MTGIVVPGVAYAEANWGRWVARCPGRYCRSAMQVQRWQPVFRCAECGTGADVVWPPFTDDAETLLMMRPDPTTRNWVPGEDLHDLLRENLEHGITPPELENHPGGLLLSVVGDRIVHNELTAATRQMIGG